MSNDDFYAPPKASLADSDRHADPNAGDFDIMSGLLQTYSPLTLPSDLCVKCGAHGTAGKTYDKKIYYQPWWVALFILLNIIIMLIVMLIVRKKLEVSYHLCPRCKTKRKNRILISIGALVASIVGFGLGATMDSGASGALLLLSVLGALGSIIALAIVGSPPLRAKSHSEGLFEVKGASDEFLDQVAARGRREGKEQAVW